MLGHLVISHHVVELGREVASDKGEKGKELHFDFVTLLVVRL